MNVYTELEVRISMSCSLVWSQANPPYESSQPPQGFGVLACAWHPHQPWLFTAGSDGRAYLWAWGGPDTVQKYTKMIKHVQNKIVKYCEVHLSLCCICRSWVKFLHADFMTERKTADSPLKPQLINVAQNRAGDAANEALHRHTSGSQGPCCSSSNFTIAIYSRVTAWTHGPGFLRFLRFMKFLLKYWFLHIKWSRFE